MQADYSKEGNWSVHRDGHRVSGWMTRPEAIRTITQYGDKLRKQGFEVIPGCYAVAWTGEDGKAHMFEAYES